jgi:hypothetical protein
MGTRKPNMAGSIRAIRTVLLEDWDPCLVRDAPEAQDEYDSYALQLYGMLRNGTSEEKLAEYLYHIETDRMGSTVRKDALIPVAQKLFAIDVSDDEPRR